MASGLSKGGRRLRFDIAVPCVRHRGWWTQGQAYQGVGSAVEEVCIDELGHGSKSVVLGRAGGLMMAGAASMAAAAIRSDRRVAAAILHLVTPDFRAAVATVTTKVAKLAAELAPIYSAAFSQLTKLGKHLEPVLSESRAVEYEKLLIEIGYNPTQARFLANLAIAKGGPYAKNVTECRRRFGAAMRRITGAKSALAIARRARELLPELENWAKLWVEDGLRKAGSPLSVQEFHGLVRQAADQETRACARLQEVARAIFPHLPKARGKAVAAITMTHAIILVFAHDRGHPEGYTYAEFGGGYIDKMTAAAIRQFGLDHFNPTSSRQLLKSLKLAEG